MNDDRLVAIIRKFVEDSGLDSIYFLTIVVLLILLSYWKELKNWENEPGWSKSLVSATIFGAIITSIISILKLIGIIKF